MEAPKNLLGSSVNNAPKQGQLPAEPPKKTSLEAPRSAGWLNRKLWLTFVIGLILGVIVAWAFIGTKEGSEEPTAKDEEGAEESAGLAGGNTKGAVEDPAMAQENRREAIVIAGSNEISVQNQAAGMVVEVELARFSIPGWVAVHEDRAGELGNILGARRLDPGIHLTEVELLRPTVSGGTYHAVMYLDNGDRQFDSSEDAPIKNAEDRLIESVFKAE